MVEKDNTIPVNCTIRISQANKIEKDVNEGKFRNFSNFFQTIIDEHYEGKHKYLMKDAVIFIVYPFIISIIFFSVAVIFNSEPAFYFNLLLFGLSIASVYNFFYKLKHGA